MQFTIAREALLKPLQLVANTVERRQTLSILSNVLLVLKNGELSLTGTDLEVEMIGRAQVSNELDAGEITVPARKLFDIVKSLPDSSDIDFTLDNNKLTVKSGRSRFTLTTLPASDFPAIEDNINSMTVQLQQKQLKRLIDAVSFSMAQQDVRYYLNGMMLEISTDHIRSVATDGHRLALCNLEQGAAEANGSARQLILPRKGVLEMVRILQESEEAVTLLLSHNHLRAQTPEFTFTTKLVDGKFPDYERVLPRPTGNNIVADRQLLKQAFQRAAILSNEKYRGVRLVLENNLLTLIANNPEQEEAEELIGVDYQGNSFEIGFNVNYVVEVLNTLTTDEVKIALADANSSALIEGVAETTDAKYVVMPMRL